MQHSPAHEGFSRKSVGKWLIKFDDGKLELDENRGRNGNVTELAELVRQRFLSS